MKVLSDWLTKNEMTAAALARRLNASRSAVHRIVHGDRNPSLRMAHNIAQVTGIPVSKLRPDLAKMFQGERQ
jgi:transcriptional regulator with XRE-family HTH domain